jgi:uncharacterized protein
MKKIWLGGILLAVPLALVSLTSCGAVPAVMAPGLLSANNTFLDAAVADQQAIISVNGTGIVTVTPDVANVNLGVQVQESTVSAAQAGAASAMEQIMAVLKANNIADNDIQTVQFSIYPSYNYDSKTGGSTISGYTVSNVISVKIRNIDNAGAVIDAVAPAGGNHTVINSIYFSVSDPSPYYSQARELAMNDAKAKAQQLASLGGVTLGKPVYITDSSYTPSSVNYAKDSAGMTTPSTQISAGSSDITISVQVSYSIS